MKRIKLTNGTQVLVDEDDYYVQDHYEWRYMDSGWGSGYAARSVWENGRSVVKLMHREIMGAESGQIVDHRNGNGLDNRRKNLRLCDSSKNSANQPKRSDSASPYKGITKTRQGRWTAYIRFQGEKITLGTFGTAKKAARVYDSAALTLFGEFAQTNFKDSEAKPLEQILAERPKRRYRNKPRNQGSGVHFLEKTGLWVARYNLGNGEREYLGAFKEKKDAEEAVAARKKRAKRGKRRDKTSDASEAKPRAA